MRPVLLAALLAVPFLHGCASTCSTEGLSASLAALPDASPDAAAAMLAAASCKGDEGLQAWLTNPGGTPPSGAWEAACSGGPDAASLQASPKIANRQAAYATCKVEETGLADEAGFVTASGHPALAVATARSLSANDKVDDATAIAVAKAILGAPAFELPDLALPTIAGTPVDPGPANVVISADSVRVGEAPMSRAELSAAPPHGPGGHQIQALAEAAASLDKVVLAAPAEVPARELHRIIASVGKPGSNVTLLTLATVDGKPDAPHGVPLAVPAEPPALTARFGPGTDWTLYDDEAARAPMEGCPSPGGTVCKADGLAPALAAEKAPVAIAPSPGMTVQDLVNLATAVGQPLSFDTRLAPCLSAPEGMVCIPGGPTLSGDKKNFAGDGPSVVHESTLYADIQEASVADYKACVADGACPDVRTSADDNKPMTGLSFIQARFYCTHQGKRLPSQWEFERMASPPGAPAAATCAQVNHGGCDGGLRATSAGEPNAWGLRDVLGNAREATASYPRIRTETCGDRCAGWDPLGFCDEAPYCKGRLTRVLKGGSASAPAGEATPQARMIERKKRSVADLGVRCVADSPILNSFPPDYVQNPPPEPATPGALTADQIAVLDAITEDKIDEIPECDDGRRGSSRTDCKDPTHYIYPNEDRGFITYPYIQNRGGALLGVGSDQNYTFAAIARSELVFLLDYDAIVVHIHRVNQAFIKAEDTPDGFVERWNPENRAKSLEIIEAEWKGDPMAETYKRTLRSLNRIMYRHYTQTRDPSPSGQTSWLRDKAKYDYVKGLWEQGRVRTLKGDMLGPNAMTGVGKALTELGVPMRIYYTSNAPNAWGGHLTPEYKRNSLSFPMDERSIVLQALGWTNEFGQQGHWHFNVQDGPEFQRKLGLDGYQKLWQITRPYRATDDIDLTLTDLKGTWEDAHAK